MTPLTDSFHNNPGPNSASIDRIVINSRRLETHVLQDLNTVLLEASELSPSVVASTIDMIWDPRRCLIGQAQQSLDRRGKLN